MTTRKLCTDCKWYSPGISPLTQAQPDLPPMRPYCRHELGRDLTGAYLELSTLRYDGYIGLEYYYCGPDGKWWEAKP